MAAQRASGRRGIGDIKVYLARKIGTCTKLVSALKMLLSVFAHFHVSSQKNYECMQPRELARDFVVPIEFVVLVKQIISVGLLWTSAYNIDIDSMGESFSLSLKQFTSGAAATACACVFTNPIEIVKTRLQLNGEMHVPRVYRSPWHAAALMMQEEGASVFVKGLRPAILYQIGMNGTRLGMYRPLKESIHFSSSVSGSFASALVAGALAGACGSLLASPLYLLKVRLQSSSTAAATRVGYQHKTPTSLYKALLEIVRCEGVAGLWRGAQGQLLRVVVGSSFQLASYDQSKMLLMRSIPGCTDGAILHLMAGMLSGIVVAFAMSPFDVAATRLMNQKVMEGGHGELYSGVFDCLLQTVRSEGLVGLYKGFPALYLRLGPHTMLTFVFLEQFNRLFS